MATYGLTPQGPNIKRLDVILEEMHEDMSKKLGVNTRQNPQSLLNHILTNISDRIAELWEFGLDVYYSQYPSTATDSSLDNAAQFGGSTREMPAKSFYSILCTGVDGTVVPAGTLIASDTNPAINLTNQSDGQITRSSFNKAVVVLASESDSSALSIVLNGELYSGNTLEALASVITDDAFEVDYADGRLTIEATDEASSNTMVLSENLTTETVASIIQFGTVDYGDTFIPNGAITKIVKTVAGLESVINVGSYIAGRLTETDTEFRQSYADKIYNRSSAMLESIKSAILENVQGVESVAPYENYTDATDSMGRPPHSIEIVVDGGSATEIAQQILNTKAGGINTFGDVETVLPGVYGEDITVRFNRPTYVYVWFQVGVTLSGSTNPPTNYADLIKETILECMEEVEAGSDVIPQRFTTALYNRVSGIDYFDIRLFSSTESGSSPSAYTERSVSITARQRAITSESRIGVVIDG
nr:MAG TPA: Baseplate wedge protein [Caudoviricetes sp.]